MHPFHRLRAAVLGLSAIACVAASAPAWAGPDVAVVDMVRLIEEHPERKMLDKRYEQAGKDAEANAQEQAKQLQSMKTEIEKLQAEDPERVLRIRNFETQRIMADFAQKWAAQQAIAEYAAGLESLYASVVTQVARYARENGIKVVLQRRADEPKAPTHEEFYLRLRLRTVVFHDAAVDITGQVQARLRAAAGAADSTGTSPGR